jgi:hypothetical protein
MDGKEVQVGQTCWVNGGSRKRFLRLQRRRRGSASRSRTRSGRHRTRWELSAESVPASSIPGAATQANGETFAIAVEFAVDSGLAYRKHGQRTVSDIA